MYMCMYSKRNLLHLLLHMFTHHHGRNVPCSNPTHMQQWLETLCSPISEWILDTLGSWGRYIIPQWLSNIHCWQCAQKTWFLEWTWFSANTSKLDNYTLLLLNCCPYVTVFYTLNTPFPWFNSLNVDTYNKLVYIVVVAAVFLNTQRWIFLGY